MRSHDRVFCARMQQYYYKKVNGAVTLEDVTFGYQSGQNDLKACVPVCEAGTEDCLCRIYRGRKNDDY